MEMQQRFCGAHDITLYFFMKVSVLVGTQWAAVTTWYVETKVPPQSCSWQVLHMIAACQGHAPGVEIFPPTIEPMAGPAKEERLAVFTPQETGGRVVAGGGSVGKWLVRTGVKTLRSTVK